jgi:S-(hydroxymethyl)glutathione dehydrogenase/alcohol dehydrogenase
VVGVGGVGLNAIQGAVIQRAEVVIAIDRDPSRLELARRFGAPHTWLATDEDLLDGVRSLTAGRGADFAFECAGHESSIQLSLEAVRRGGAVVLLGKTQINQRVAIRFGSLMGEKRIVRSSYGGARPQRDFPWLARLYLDGVLKLDQLITQRLKLSEINAGFDAMRRGLTVRSILKFDAR